MDVLAWIGVGVLAMYLFGGLGVLVYYDHIAGWPDRGQAMPLFGCVISLFFFPSYLLYLATGKLWNWLFPDGEGLDI